MRTCLQVRDSAWFGRSQIKVQWTDVAENKLEEFWFENKSKTITLIGRGGL
jgi:hypothetical protein